MGMCIHLNEIALLQTLDQGCLHFVGASLSLAHLQTPHPLSTLYQPSPSSPAPISRSPISWPTPTQAELADSTKRATALARLQAKFSLQGRRLQVIAEAHLWGFEVNETGICESSLRSQETDQWLTKEQNSISV